MSQMYPLRFEPIYQYRLWGGRRLAGLLTAPLPGNGPIGEAWVRSDRDDHASRVADRALKGRTFSQLLAQFPEQVMGKLAGDFHRFPLLLKFLNARDRRMGYGTTLLFVATFGVQNGLLGAILTLSGRPLYAAYGDTTASWGLTPLEDQQIAGLLMWIPASLIHLAALGFLFIAWMRTAERRAVLETRLRSENWANKAALSLVLIGPALLALGGCSQ